MLQMAEKGSFVWTIVVTFLDSHESLPIVMVYGSWLEAKKRKAEIEANPFGCLGVNASILKIEIIDKVVR